MKYYATTLFTLMPVETERPWNVSCETEPGSQERSKIFFRPEVQKFSVRCSRRRSATKFRLACSTGEGFQRLDPGLIDQQLFSFSPNSCFSNIWRVFRRKARRNLDPTPSLCSKPEINRYPWNIFYSKLNLAAFMFG